MKGLPIWQLPKIINSSPKLNLLARRVLRCPSVGNAQITPTLWAIKVRQRRTHHTTTFRRKSTAVVHASREHPTAVHVSEIKESSTYRPNFNRGADKLAHLTNKFSTLYCNPEKASFLCSYFPFRNHIVKKIFSRAEQLQRVSHTHTTTASSNQNPGVASSDAKKNTRKNEKKGFIDSSMSTQYEGSEENSTEVPVFEFKESNTHHTNLKRKDNKKLSAKKKNIFPSGDQLQIELSEHQENVLKAISRRESVFFTGAAGTGKTYLLQHAIKVLTKVHGKNSVFVTASTGLAASALRGTTLHSFAGIGLGLDDVDKLVWKVKRDKRACSRWKSAKALVIDEISMISGDLFDKLNCIAQRIRGQCAGFGGLQLVVAGDFCQLPPVKEPNVVLENFFTFQAGCWDECFDLQTELTSIFRQSDVEFVKILNEIRRGVCSPETINTLKTCQGMPNDDGIAFTKLYPLKVDVARENEQKLKELDKAIITYVAEDSVLEHATAQLDGMVAVKELSLCIGAQVMLIYKLNIKRGLVNGRKGVVIGFQSDTGETDTPLWPIVKFQGFQKEEIVKPQCYEVHGFDKKGKAIVVAKRLQIPLVLAWALSVHKCQGMALDGIETDLRKAFEYGMVYVALSRLKKLDGLRLTGFHPSRVKAHPDVLDFYEKLSKN